MYRDPWNVNIMSHSKCEIILLPNRAALIQILAQRCKKLTASHHQAAIIWGKNTGWSHHGVRVVVPRLDEEAHGVGGGLEQGDQGVGLVPHPDHHLLSHGGGVGNVCINLKDWLVLSEATLDKLLIRLWAAFCLYWNVNMQENMLENMHHEKACPKGQYECEPADLEET